MRGALPDGSYMMGIRPHHVSPALTEGSGQPWRSKERFLVTELSGSESVIHFELGGRTWVSQSHGIHAFQVGEVGAVPGGDPISVFISVTDGERFAA